jgi:chromosome segregation ATPase
MKKWLFVISPACMLAVFLVFYVANRKDEEAREVAHQQELAKQKADADERKRIAEAKAHDDAEKRNQERIADEARVAKEKQDKYDAKMAQIKGDTDASNAKAEAYSKQVSDLSIELDNLYKQKESLTRENFEYLKKVQLAEVNRHDAEMDIQRMVAMIADRADKSSMTVMPPPPPPPAKDNS